MSTIPRIALLCHSTNPRGGVAHALAVGEALCRAGYLATVVAPDALGHGFPRKAGCPTVAFAAARVEGGLAELVRVRAAEYCNWINAASGQFDLFHAHDALSGSVLADAIAGGLTRPFVRTVHHLDDFADPQLAARQAQSVTAADAVLCVSHTVAADVARRYGRKAVVVGNGVDGARFGPDAGPRDAFWKRRLGAGGPLVLSVGGIESRKNTVRLLQAFDLVRGRHPGARLAIVGGASLLNHTTYARTFDDALAAGGPGLAGAVTRVGVVDDADMPSLYRAADVLAFPSVHEGFGLAVLEAMACGTPVAVSWVAPFTEYLNEADASGCDSLDVDSIATALLRAIDPAQAQQYRRRGFVVAGRHSWTAVADAHVGCYRSVLQGALLCQR
ncbi:MAG TPA: MSMEG_0565 family glycosyltransferase [Tepidisphaeraceae bacterium]|jgi:glycosyltransferase-like protein